MYVIIEIFRVINKELREKRWLGMEGQASGLPVAPPSTRADVVGLQLPFHRHNINTNVIAGCKTMVYVM